MSKRAYGCLLFLSALCCAYPSLAKGPRGYIRPQLEDAVNYPAHDEHTAEHVAVAADPYDTPNKLQAFSIPFGALRFLPVLVVLSNHSDQPVSALDLHVELVSPRRMKLLPVEEEDIRRRLTHARAPATSPLPIPLPRGSRKNPLAELHEEFSEASFNARAIEPHANQGGFLFFDISGISEPLEGANLIVSGLKDNDGKELFYFEISLERYLQKRPELSPR